jgi:hypothetical protein
MPRTRKDEAPAPVDAPFIHGQYAPETTARDLAGKLITFMETGAPPEGLFTPDVFCDFTMPQWRLQAQGVEDLVALRKAGHPGPSRVPRSRFDATATGFVLEVEEEWDSGGEPGTAASCSARTSPTAPSPRSRCTAPATGTASGSAGMPRRFI